MNATHTPTPWSFAQTYNGEFSVCSSRERVANHVATVPIFNGMSHSGASVPHEASVAEANAAFIVRCVNAHDDLVMALQASQAFIQVIARETSKDFAVLDRISAALAKAGAA